MPTAILNRSDTGIYEQALTAGQTLVVTVQSRYDWETPTLEVINHGTTVIYAKAAATVTLKEPGATLIAPSGWATLYVTTQLAIIASSDTTISINRAR